jgi:hypothetical protein
VKAVGCSGEFQRGEGAISGKGEKVIDDEWESDII